MRTLYILFFALLISCEYKSNKNESDNNDTISNTKTSEYSNTVERKRLLEDEHPFTKNPVVIKLASKIYVDSLKPYFMFKDIKKLDKICEMLTNEESDSLCTVIFPSRDFKVKFKKDTVHLSHYQFLIGNLKTSENQVNILVFMNYVEDWGRELFIASISKENEILDIEFLCSNQGDGGDFYDTEIKDKGNFNYTLITKHGYHPFSEPIDTFTYTKTVRRVNINNDGSFKNQLVSIDSNIVELVRVKK